MFDEEDPYLRQVRELAAAFPGSAEKVSHGRPAFYTKKVFAYYGASLKVSDEWVQHPHSVVLKLDTGEREALLHDSDAFVPAYLGPSGWLGVDMDKDTDWIQLAELIDASYRLTAPISKVRELDL